LNVNRPDDPRLNSEVRGKGKRSNCSHPGGTLKKIRFHRLVLAIGMILSALSISFPQRELQAQSMSTTSTLSGTVSDPAGARIPKADVKLTNPEIGITRTSTAGPEGEFSFALLVAGTYTLEVSAPGFKTTRQSGITLTEGDSQNIGVSLTVGASEQVEVNATGPLLQTQDANIGTELSTKQIEELPLNLRNVLGFAMLNSSVNNLGDRQLLAAGGGEDTADQDMSFLNFGGGYFGTNLFLLDGGFNTAQSWGGIVYVPAVEDTAEVKVTSYSFSSEYGLSTGNVINMSTKAGTHDFHFVADEFIRNQALDANEYFHKVAGIPRTPDHRNQFGVGAGGPLYIPGLYRQRDKTYFYGFYSGLRLSNAGNLSAQVPTTAQLGGDFSSELTTTSLGADCLGRTIYQGAIYNPYSFSTCPGGGKVRDPYPGNIIPATGAGGLDGLAQKFATGSYWPAPKNPGGGYNFNATASQATTSNEWGIRIDQNFNANNRMYGQFSNKHEGKAGEAPFYGPDDIAGPGLFDPNNRMFGVMGASHVFSPTFILSSTLFFVRNTGGNVVQGYGFHPSTLGLPGQLDSWTPQFPQLSFSGSNYAPLGATAGAGQASYPYNAISLGTDLNKTYGTHSVSVGYMGIWQTVDGGRIAPTTYNFSNAMTQGPDPLSTPSACSTLHLSICTGDAFASFIAGVGVAGAGSAGGTGFNAFPATTYYTHGGYVQDDWKLTRRLTLNMGIRYELQLPPTARHNIQAHFDFHALNPISSATGAPVYGEEVYNTPGNRGLYEINKDDIAPRVGFAYSVNPKLVFRGGFGLYYSRNFYNGNGPAPGYSTVTPWTSSVDGVTVSTPLAQAFQSGLVPITGSSQGGLTNVGQGAGAGGGDVNPYRPDPRLKQFMFGFQYAFSPNDLLDVNYVGSRGDRITLGSMAYGQLDPKYLAMGTALNNPVANPFAGALSNLGLPNMSCEVSGPVAGAHYVPQAQLLLPYPEFCGAVAAAAEPIAETNYNALQASFTHRFGQGLIFTASYTYSKFMSDTGGPEEWGSINGDTGGSSIRNFYNLRGDWSVDAEDIPQSLVLNYVYELPVGRGKTLGASMNRVADAVVGGWQISGITSVQGGLPLAIGNSNAYASSLWGGNQHANLTGAAFRKGNCGSMPVGTQYCFFNPGAFAQAPAYTFGDGPRYYSNLRGPGYVNQDLGLAKWFTLAEKLRMQFAVQMFNTFNHANFGVPNTSIGNSTMGQSSSTLGPRQTQASLKLTF
jgi:hypothetical protein